MTASSEPARRLQVCAHRHGNDLLLLRAAEAVGVDLVEVDIHLYRNELDARHEKTVGPLPIVWDRRRRPAWNPPRQRLDEVLARAQPGTTFYVDLKGWSRRLSRRVITAFEPRHRYVVSSRAWWLLHPFRRLDDVYVLRSIGAAWQLRLFRLGRRGAATGGVSIRSDLLSETVVTELKSRADVVFAWNVTTTAHARQLEQWGVDGVIVDSLDLARELLDRQG
ncbi:MAG: glycerophosphodiester phosphodiesterase [Acidimicrobiales bacterium]